MRSFIFIGCVLLASVAAQNSELCDVNTCPNGQTCYKRPNPPVGEADHVCECASPFQMGFDCTVPSDNQQLITSYGSNSGVEYFESANYPGNYNDRARVLYLLFVPGATSITITFDSQFGIEENKDELYVGRGLEFDFGQLDSFNDPANDKYFFEGRTRPDSFTINSDAVWVYFLTDKNNNDMTYQGFRLRWSVPIIDTTPPVISGCPVNIVRSINIGASGTSVIWTSPTATDDSGVANLISRSHQSGTFFNVGTTAISYVFSDASGNTAICAFNVVIVSVDNTPPVIGQLPDVRVTVELGSATAAQATWLEPTATDDSGSTTLVSRTNSPESFFPLGSTPVTYTFQDPSGNQASITFNVIVDTVDTTPPVITPLDDINVVIPITQNQAQVTWTEPTATDNSDNPTLVSRTRSPNDFFSIGTTQVTYTYTDPSGNTASETFNVNVFQDCSIWFCGTSVNWIEPTATDDSGTASLIARTRSPNSFFNVGTTPVTYTYQDPSGNTASITFNVIVTEQVQDNQPPVISPINDITVTVPSGSAGTSVNWVEPTATDDSGTATLIARTRSPNSFFNVGTTPVTYTYQDPSGNTASITFNVNVIEEAQDNQAPVISPIDDITEFVPAGSPGTSVNWVEPTATDDSGTATLIARTRSPNSFFNVGTTPVTYTYQDPSGNTASITFNVNVFEQAQDNQAPVISPIDDITEFVPAGSPGTSVNWVEPTATDDSGTATLIARTRSPNSFFNVGTTPVTYTYQDPSGNTASITFNVNVIEQVQDNQAPVISPIEDITEFVPAGSPGTSVNWVEPTATDDSGTATLIARTRSPNSFFNVGTTPVTYTYQDPSGNTASITFNVNVIEEAQDNQAPVISPIDDITEFVPAGSPGTSVNWVEPTATDDSGTATLIARTRSPNSFFNVGTTPVTYTYQDPSGNTASITFNVNVIEEAQDNQAPVIGQIDDITVFVPAGSPGTSVNWVEPTATDDSGAATLIARTRSPNSFFNVGTTPVTYTYQDPSGNTASITFNVNVIEEAQVDDEAPVIENCPININEITPLNTGGRTITWTSPTATDNSGVVTLAERSNAPGSFFLVGTTTVSYRFVDGSGNEAICSFTVTVTEVDSTAPVIENCEDVAATVGLNIGGVVVTWTEPTAADNSGTVNLISRSRQPGQFFVVGTTAVTYRFQDGSGNVATCTFNVIVTEIDDQPPVIENCEDVAATVGLNVGGVVVTWIEPTATDNSGTVNLVSRSRQPGQFFVVGTTAVTYRFQDGSGNVETCTFDVTVIEVDDQPPVIENCEDVAATVGLNVGGVVVTWTEPIATDSSGIVNLISRSRQPGQFFVVGTTSVTYQFQDGSGNVATCTFDVTVIEVDDQAPVIENCEDVAATVGLNVGGVVVTWTEPTATDSSGIVNLVSRSRQPGQFFVVGTTSVTYQFQDGSGNVATCTFDVTVIEVDDQAPVIENCEDVAATVGLNVGGVVVTWIEPTATDNSGTVNLVSRSRQPGQFFVVGTTSVTYQFQDGSGNVETCTFDVTVIEVDDEAPVIENCPININEITPLNTGGRTITWTSPTATDNSGVVTLAERSNAPGSFFLVGTTTVSYRFVDGSGNEAICSFAVTVNEVDGTDPVIENCEDVAATVGLNVGGVVVTWTEPTATDNSGTVNLISRSRQPGQFFVVGSTSVTYRFQDGSGNVATCTFNVIVTEIDDQAPVIENCEDVAATVGLNVGGVVVTWTEPIATDSSGIVNLISRSRQPGQFFVVGTTSVTYQFQDGSGNVATCTFDVTVIEVDDQAPVIENCEDVAATVGLNIGGVVVTWIEPTATDSSGIVNLVSRSRQPGQFFVVGSTSVTYQFQDGSGNVATCTFDVTVIEVDDEAPVIENCDDVAETIGLNIGGVVVTWTEPIANDNSGTVNLQSRTRQPGQFFVVGSTPVTYRFVDESGNVATCTFNVVVTEVDDEAPTVVCVDDISRTIPLGAGGTTVTWNEPSATDNSNSVSLSSRSDAPGAFFTTGSTQVIYVFADPSGNSANCIFFITIEEVDGLPPVIQDCPLDLGETTPLGSGGRTVTWTSPTATDNSGIVTLAERSNAPGSFFLVGTTTVTYRFVDGSGNEAICAFDVAVIEVDTIPPVIICVNDITETTGLGSPGTIVAWEEPTATDNSGIVSLSSRSRQPGSFFNVGNTDVTYEFVDGSGNSATCTFTINVIEVDSTPPVIETCEDVAATVGLNIGGVVVTYTEPTAIDNSGTVNLLSRSRQPGQFFVVGSTSVTYQFVDGSGNVATCTFNVLVTEVDEEAPLVFCIDDISQVIPLNAGGIEVTWNEPSATDNSGTATLSSRSHAPGEFFPTGSTQVLYVFADPSGNSATCIFVVDVTEVDGEAPVVTQCVDDITQTIPLNAGGIIVTWIEPIATDNSGSVTVASRSRVPGSFFNTGTTQVTYRFVDPSNNAAVCTFRVFVNEVDSTMPEIFCLEDITETTDLGSAGTTVTWIEPTAIDNSGVVSLSSRSHAPGSFFLVGETDVTYRFVDGSGNEAQCTFVVGVVEVDRVPPTVQCIEDVAQTVALNIGAAQVDWIEPTATDNSGTANLQSRTRRPGTFFLVGSTDVTYVFVDPSGNTASCTFAVNVIEVDDVPPTVFCLDDITSTIPLNTGGTTITWVVEPSATDNSGSVAIVQQSHASGDFFVTGSTSVTYIFADPSGNTESCIFAVIIDEVDGESPEITQCVDDITETIPLNAGGVVITWLEPSATDNSGSVTVESRSHAPGEFFNTGFTQVIYTFADPSGNTANCIFNVIVNEVDGTPPVVVCVDDVTETTPLGSQGATVTWIAPTATDNSGVVNLVSRSRAPGSFFLVGSSDVTYRFVDGSGNEAICTFAVNVIEVDEVPPVINCINNVFENVEINTPGTIVLWDEPTATDNSGVVNLASRSRSPGSFFLVGSTDVTYRFIDGSGNSAECTFAVIVNEVDTTDPLIACLENIIQIIELGEPGATVTWVEPTATDNSGTVNQVSRSRAPDSFFNIGSSSVTYIFSDPSGNTATCTFDVTVETVDTTGPVPICTDGVEASVELGTAGTTITWVIPTATDNSGQATILTNNYNSGDFFNVGTTTVIYTFQDPSGNTAACSWPVTVLAVDTQSPVLVCSEDISRTVPLGAGGASITWNVPQATDNSGVINVVSTSHSSGFFFSPGTTVVTYEVADPSDNTAECSWLVTVIEVDEVPPFVIGCPGNINDFVSLGIPGKVITWSEPSSNDNSGVSTISSRSHPPGSFFLVDATTVTYVFSDESGNTAECSFVVTISEIDDVNPVVTCPANIEITIRSGEGGTTIEFTEPTATDDSGTANRVSFTHQSSDFFPIGTTTVTYRFADNSGNVGSCSFEIVVSDADPCAIQPCLNGGVCVVESLTEYSCICPECYSGQTCEIAQNACDNNNCGNGAACTPVAGSCEAYTCECTDCFFGEYCLQTSNPCDNNQCANGAQCLPDPDDCTRYFCACPACYEGQFCELAIDACANNLCNNGAQCVPLLNGACTEYTCSCSGCFTGQYCELERSACDRNPCANGGQCSEIAGSCSSYTCECQGCFTGYNCELLLANPCENSPCENGGQCNVIAGQCFAYSCACPEGYGGVNCQTIVTQNVNPCASYPCINGGECLTMDATNYICMCPEGYAGVNCQTSTSNSPFYDSCSQTPNGLPHCNPENGGTCVNSYNSNSLINSNFASPQYSCICGDGYTGSDCQLTTADNPDLDICNQLGRPRCDNGGVCHNAYHQYDADLDYYCDCPVGYIGHNCETPYFDPCASGPCQNGAQCTAFTTYFTCQCQDGFIGTNCETNTNVDLIPPVVSNVPSSVYVYTPNGGAIVNWDSPTATDNSGTANLIRRTRQPNSFFPLGTTPVTYVFADPSNNAVSVTFFITVLSDQPELDTEAPVISNCPEAVIVQVANDASSGIAAWDIPTATDNSGATPARTSNFSPGQSFPLGGTFVRYTFRDAAGNAAVCSFEVTISPSGIAQDTTPPVISNCPAALSLQAPSGVTRVIGTWASPTATDDSGVEPTRTSTHISGASFPIGTTLVRYVFSDAAGNSAICAFDVTVRQAGIVVPDTTPPVISNCPAAINLQVDAGVTEATATWNSPTATDNSGDAPTRSSNYNSGESFPVGVTLVIYTFSDAAGNTATCSFEVIVRQAGIVVPDTTAPVISDCPAAINLQVDSGATEATATWTSPTATDNSGVAPTITTTHTSGASFPIGSTLVIYTFSDAAGNTAICSFEVTVRQSGIVIPDTTAPVISGCPDDITVSATSSFTLVQWTAPTATDAVSEVSVETNYPQPRVFVSSDMVPFEVVYTFSDVAGNDATCRFTISLSSGEVDQTPPVISGCPSPIAVDAPAGATSTAVTWTNPTATDNSGAAPSVTASHAPGDLFTSGVTLVSIRFEDATGNSATCSFNVIVNTQTLPTDNTPPSITGCPATVRVTAAEGEMSAVASWLSPTATDDSGVQPSVSASHTSGSIFQVGTTTVTYTFEDGTGNQAICSFNVVITAANPGNPCASNPCALGQACYYTATQFICLG
ncbi:uncharacterized protein [Amphiura filiformis]|uniref:uncharacterized protein n=1 Tax=Amphiura filiformis TaxID=82378 RepID=UPI003B224FE8